MSNRVEELESKVAELQAAVNGLTEELVEAKERVRQLEDAAQVEVETPESSGFAQGAQGDVGAEVQSAEAEEADGEGAKSHETQENNEETAESEDSDIIVA